MKVILLSDVVQVGRRHEIKSVSDGYAANYLFPRKLAEPATEGNIKRLKERALRVQEEQALHVALFQKNLEALAHATLEMKVRANDQGHLFEGIHAPEIVQALKQNLHIDIDEHFLKLSSPLKSVGKHLVDVEGHGHRGSVKITILPA